MSNPSVTATISANDLASPKIRELMATLRQAERLAKDAFDGNHVGGKYAAGVNAATAAAQKHVGVLHQVHAAHKAIAATVAGYAGLKMVHGGIEAVKHALPYLREDTAIKARTGYSDRDMAALRRQQVELAQVYGSHVEATQKMHETFGRLKYDAATNIAISRPTATGARAMGVTSEQNSELMESMISQYGIHFDNPADAARKATRLNDLAAVATKKSNMTFGDVLDYTRYSAAAANAAGVSPETNLAMGMALRRGGIVGSEGGVFARQFYARELAPTRKGREVLAQNGINIDDYAEHGTITGQGLSDKMARTFGKRLSDAAIAGIDKQLEENGGEILSDRGKFAEMVANAAEKSGDKLSKTDQRHLSRAANEYFDFTKQGFKGEGLLNAILAANNPMIMQGFLGDKQGARGVALLQERDKYTEARSDLAHADGYAQNVANEMNQGLAAAVDRLTSSAEALSNSMVQANEGWIAGVTNAATSVVGVFNNLSDSGKQAVGVFAGIATVAAGGGSAYLFASFLRNVGSLATAAGEAAISLKVLAGSAAPGLPGKPGTLGSSGKGAIFKTGAAALGGVIGGPLVGIAAWQAGEIAWPLIEKWASEDDVAPGSPEDTARRRRFGMAKWGAGPSSLNRITLGPDTSGGLSGSQPGTGGWMDSITRGNVGPSQGWGDGRTSSQVTVEGSVSGSAELHSMIQVTVNPSQYLESVVANAQAASRMNLNGRMGTSMQGPGDNGTVPSTGGNPSGGHH